MIPPWGILPTESNRERRLKISRKIGFVRIAGYPKKISVRLTNLEKDILGDVFFFVFSLENIFKMEYNTNK